MSAARDFQALGLFQRLSNRPCLFRRGLTSYLATHREYERRGVGGNTVLLAIGYAGNFAENTGCWMVAVGADPEVAEFYEKIGFVHATAGVPGSGSGALSRLKRRCTAKRGIPNMPYFDLTEGEN